MAISKERIVRAVARALLVTEPSIIRVREVAESAIEAVLDEILADVLGGQSYEINSLKNPDHLRLIYDFLPLLAMADARWRFILKQMDSAGRGRSPDEPVPVLTRTSQNESEIRAIPGLRLDQDPHSGSSQEGRLMAAEPVPPVTEPKE